MAKEKKIGGGRKCLKASAQSFGNKYLGFTYNHNGDNKHRQWSRKKKEATRASDS